MSGTRPRFAAIWSISSALVYDPVWQVNYVREGSAIVPALRHSTGKTSTTTASSDARPGNDYDDDYTED